MVFDDLAFFFDHQNLAQAGGKFAGGVRFEGPNHAHFVHPDAQALAGGVIQSQIKQGLACVVESFAAGDQAEPIVRPLDHVVVELIGADVGQGGVPLVIKQAGFLFERGVGPADVHAAGRHDKFGQNDLHTLWINVGGGAGLDNFLNGLHARPNAGKAAQGDGVQALVEDVLHTGREKHRQTAGLEDVVALVCGGGAFGHMVIARHRQHAAPGRGARHVGVFEDV